MGLRAVYWKHSAYLLKLKDLKLQIDQGMARNILVE